VQINIIKNAKKLVGLSVVFAIVAIGVFFLKGLNYGIDFTGGNLIQLKFEKTVTLNQINVALDEVAKQIPQVGANSRKVQIAAEDNAVIIRTPEINENQQDQLLADLTEKVGSYEIDKTEKVGSSVGEELKTSAILALGIGGLLIVLYITFRFDFKFSVAAILALLHDLVIAIGGIALLGYEVNTPFIAAVLTILGYSINDTIVVFDRIRESLRRKNSSDFGEVLNKSVNQVMTRSINTSITTLLAIIAILFFGGDSLKTFIVTLLIGVLAGTYSSIFLATPIVYLLEKNKDDYFDHMDKNNHDDDENEDKILV
jgi:preprotein translocase subunit SecF